MDRYEQKALKSSFNTIIKVKLQYVYMFMLYISFM